MNTLSDETPRCSPIGSTIDGFTITAPPPSTSADSRRGGGQYKLCHSNTIASSPTTQSATTTPSGQETFAETIATTPDRVTTFRTEPSSLPPTILSPIAAIVVIVIAAIFGIVRVISITMHVRGETDAEAVMPTEQTERKKAIAAIIGIVVVAVAAIIVIVIALI